MKKDVTVIGGGIIGVATALQIIKNRPELKVVVLEKERELGLHQTGNNSGVIHSGIYYRPDSQKAELCKTGREILINYCKERGVPYEICGKIIVATNSKEVDRLKDLKYKADKNGIHVVELDSRTIQEVEPYARGMAALYVSSAGIVNFRQVVQSLVVDFQSLGGEVIKACKVTGIHTKPHGFDVTTTNSSIRTGQLVGCAGLYSDKIAEMCGIQTSVCIIPFRGEYYKLKSEASHYCRNLIYPVPDPELPFLGVHFTRTMSGEVECGPNAVLAFAREGYSRSKINTAELFAMLKFPGFWRMTSRYWKVGIVEYYRSISRKAFLSSLKKLIPDLPYDAIVAGGSGVRAQAVTRKGALVDDFQFADGKNCVNVINAPSPAATSSLAIANLIAQRVLRSL